MTHSFTNKLIHESSPYLLQHAHNPVDWHPWGEEALQKAKAEDKVILVSIGYSACHWCHVMERESFENETVAKIMNEYFINIKIDREERPDLDNIYMDAVQAITGSGGWPLNVFLTPECKPFFGGTYFPPQQAFNRASWTDVLHSIQRFWKERRNEVELQADQLIEHLQKTSRFVQTTFKDIGVGIDTIFTADQCHVITENCLKKADTIWGGFGVAPKFPQTFTITYLLQYYYHFNHSESLQQALLSLDKMIQGGIYDQIGGGFARYSTDEEWLAPHFEKMLYDNALLISVLCDAYQLTKNEMYSDVITQTITFLQREMMDPAGGFYAALDADSEGEEGKFYVWTKEEIDNILQKDADLFCKYYDVTEKGNWSHTPTEKGANILRVLKTKNEFLQEEKINIQEFDSFIKTCSEKLLTARNNRIRPQLDDKILLNWNSLLITALCKTAATFTNKEYVALAKQTFLFIKKSFLTEQNSLYHTYKNGYAKYEAFLDDYAYWIQACIALQEITSDIQYLEEAKHFAEYVIANFSDEDNLFFYYTSYRQKDIIVRKKELYDGALPSGNSIMAFNLQYLSIVYDYPVWRYRADNMLQQLSSAILNYPTSFGVWAGLFLQQITGKTELVITGKKYQTTRDNLLKIYIPNKILQCAEQEIIGMPLLKHKNYEDEVLIYLCKNYICEKPVHSLKELYQSLKKNNK